MNDSTPLLNDSQPTDDEPAPPTDDKGPCPKKQRVEQDYPHPDARGSADPPLQAQPLPVIDHQPEVLWRVNFGGISEFPVRV